MYNHCRQKLNEDLLFERRRKENASSTLTMGLRSLSERLVRMGILKDRSIDRVNAIRQAEKRGKQWYLHEEISHPFVVHRIHFSHLKQFFQIGETRRIFYFLFRQIFDPLEIEDFPLIIVIKSEQLTLFE